MTDPTPHLVELMHILNKLVCDGVQVSITTLYACGDKEIAIILPGVRYEAGQLVSENGKEKVK